MSKDQLADIKAGRALREELRRAAHSTEEWRLLDFEGMAAEAERANVWLIAEVERLRDEVADLLELTPEERVYDYGVCEPRKCPGCEGKRGHYESEQGLEFDCDWCWGTGFIHDDGIRISRAQSCGGRHD